MIVDNFDIDEEFEIADPGDIVLEQDVAMEKAAETRLLDGEDDIEDDLFDQVEGTRFSDADYKFVNVDNIDAEDL